MNPSRKAQAGSQTASQRGSVSNTSPLRNNTPPACPGIPKKSRQPIDQGISPYERATSTQQQIVLREILNI